MPTARLKVGYFPMFPTQGKVSAVKGKAGGAVRGGKFYQTWVPAGGHGCLHTQHARKFAHTRACRIMPIPSPIISFILFAPPSGQHPFASLKNNHFRQRRRRLCMSIPRAASQLESGHRVLEIESIRLFFFTDTHE